MAGRKNRDPRRDEAYAIWLTDQSQSNVNIAKKLGVPTGSVRGWRSKDNWDGNKSERSGSKSGTLRKSERNAPKKVGAPKGNKNAVGNPGGGAPWGNQNALGNSGGAPERNKNAVVTGEYESILFASLDDGEMRLLHGVERGEQLKNIREQLGLLYVREKRILERMAEYKNRRAILLSMEKTQKDGLKQKFETADGRIDRCEDALTRVQDSIQKMLMAEHRAKIEIRKLELQEKNSDTTTDNQKSRMDILLNGMSSLIVFVHSLLDYSHQKLLIIFFKKPCNFPQILLF